MTQVEVFAFNPFEENTYVVFDDSGACAIFDPGCYEAHERRALQAFIESKGLRPERLINTHCHLDHVFGNRFVSDTWSLPLEIHEGELPVLAKNRSIRGKGLAAAVRAGRVVRPCLCSARWRCG